MDSGSADQALVRCALAGNEAAREAIVLRFTPIIHHRVGRVLAQFRLARGGSLERSDVLDLTQQMLLLLFDDGGHVLSSWDSTRGLSLDNFVGLVAEREAGAILRSGRRSAWAETPTADDILDRYRGESSCEATLSVREELENIWRCLEGQLSPRGLALFRALVVDDQPVEEVCAAFQISSTAAYNFRSRVRTKVRQIRASLSATSVVALHERKAGAGTTVKVSGRGSVWSKR
jgi:RNA polymerase sigma-70 factor (ECF subfamily)